MGTRGPAPSSCVYVDGEWSSQPDASVPAHDRGFLFGDGVFESLRTRGGAPVRLHAHLERLAAGAAELGIEHVPDPARIEAVVHEALERAGTPDAYVRVTVTRGAAGGFDPSDAGDPRLVVSVAELTTPRAAAGVTLALLPPGPVPEHPPPHVKATGAFLRHTIGRRRARQAGYDDGVWRDADANVTEATSSNVFAVFGRLVRTPPEEVCLPGVTRADVLAAARAAGLATSTAPLATADLLDADEVFLTSSVAGVVAARRVAGVDLEPGPVTRRLAAEIEAIV